MPKQLVRVYEFGCVPQSDAAHFRALNIITPMRIAQIFTKRSRRYVIATSTDPTLRAAKPIFLINDALVNAFIVDAAAHEPKGPTFDHAATGSE